MEKNVFDVKKDQKPLDFNMTVGGWACTLSIKSHESKNENGFSLNCEETLDIKNFKDKADAMAWGQNAAKEYFGIDETLYGDVITLSRAKDNTYDYVLNIWPLGEEEQKQMDE